MHTLELYLQLLDSLVKLSLFLSNSSLNKGPFLRVPVISDFHFLVQLVWPLKHRVDVLQTTSLEHVAKGKVLVGFLVLIFVFHENESVLFVLRVTD